MKNAILLAAIFGLYAWVSTMDYNLEVAIAAERAASQSAHVANR